MWTVCP